MEVPLDRPETADEISFASFFSDEYEGLYRTLLLMVGSRSEADDLAQEAMARVYERWGRVRAMASPAGYAYMVAFNLNHRRIRRLALGRRHTAADPEPAPATDQAEARHDVRSAIARLPLKLREAVVVTTWLDMPAEQAGRVLGVRPATVRGRVHRARKLLRDQLEDVDG